MTLGDLERLPWMGVHKITKHYVFTEHPCSAENVILCIKNGGSPVCPLSGVLREFKLHQEDYLFSPNKPQIVCVHWLLRTMNTTQPNSLTTAALDRRNSAALAHK